MNNKSIYQIQAETSWNNREEFRQYGTSDETSNTRIVETVGELIKEMVSLELYHESFIIGRLQSNGYFDQLKSRIIEG